MIFFLSNGLGDVIMTTPALRNYIKAYGTKGLTIIVSKSNHAEALKVYIPEIYKIYNLNKNIFNLIKLYLIVFFSDGPIVAPALSSKPLSLILLCLFGKKIITNSRAAFTIPWLVTRLDMNMHENKVHQVNYYINFLSKFTGLSMPQIDCMPKILYKETKIRNKVPTVILGISSGETERHKLPSPYYFANFVNKLSLTGEFNFLLISTKSDQDVMGKFYTKVQKHIKISECRDYSLQEIMHIVKKADLAISGTTGQGHIFSTCDIPMIVFHGVTNFSQSGPFAKNVIPISHNFPCGPCYDEKYRFGCGRRCMDDIEIDMVIDKVHKELDKHYKELN